ncbi:OmpW/AlkL family protein [Roseateles koreensis]|uniref:Outer membrane beta-barrel protein n=1 Tax=Roseateles koreensis TaxID=2987526 RepID=A0ABT5KUL6_9BURK|nr:OmpW family outer membrane protein [Roseateles koreensis]MDC8786522.1 outer membrane beta-barrel protein [Roseateles koreensis]
MKKTHILCAAATLLALASTAHAQSAGTFMARIGATSIHPDVNSGDLSAPSLTGTKVDINSASQVSAGITWMWTDNIAIDLPLSIPFKHEVTGAGAIAGTGKLAEVQALPATLTAQYRFGVPTSTLRPYVGAGLTYAMFMKPKSTAALSGLTGGSPSNPTIMTMENRFGPTVQMGFTAKFTDRLSLDATLTKVFVKTKGHLSTGQSIDVELNPLAYTVGLVYTF